MNNEKELLEMYHLKNVVRYSTRTKLNKETVAEHSFFVALIALKICDALEVDADIRQQCLTKAILHDMPESELNDITHDVKVKLNLYSFLEKYENEYFDRCFPKHAELMKSKEENLVNVIVDYADILSVYQYTLNEIQLGNTSDDMQEIYSNTKERIDECHNRLRKLLENNK